MSRKNDSILPLRIAAAVLVIGFGVSMYMVNRSPAPVPPANEIPEEPPEVAAAEVVEPAEPVFEPEPEPTPVSSPVDPPAAGASVVKLIAKGSRRWELQRNRKPYHVKGVGGSEHLDDAVALGVNSIRTWAVGAETRALLDRAHARNLSVTLGLWMGHKRHGFNYGNADAVRKQQQEMVAAVKAHKDHPALLCWGVGNEVETGQENDPRVWQAINRAAQAIKQEDPHHPTVIVIAELGANDHNVKMIQQHCPDIDIVGINAYDGATSVVARYGTHKIGKPCLLTEYGPPLGSRDNFGMVSEATSTQKGRLYAEIVRKGIQAHPGFCLGGYSFVWGAKTERTDTYFGQFLGSGERLGSAEVFHQVFGASPPANRCPQVQPIVVKPASRVVNEGETFTLEFPASDPDGDALRYRWGLKRELRGTVGGDHLASHKNMAERIRHAAADSPQATITAPGAGKYRIYAYVFDGKGNAGTASTTFVSKRKVNQAAAPAMQLPLTLYAEHKPVSNYAPSGVMGDQPGAVRMQWDHAAHPRSGSTCLRVSAPANAWSGVNWQHPANDWGERAGGYDATGARQLTFWARGAKGGEKITFAIGGIGQEANYPDSVHLKIEVALTTEWQAYSIDLSGKNLSRIKTPFHWSAYDAAPIEFFLDDIRVE